MSINRKVIWLNSDAATSTQSGCAWTQFVATLRFKVLIYHLSQILKLLHFAIQA